MEREIGYSSKLFFHKDVRNLRVRVILKDKVDLDILKKASSKALDDFPELKVSLKVKDNTFVYKDNNNEIAIYKEDNKERYLGSKDTNYYLFYFLYNDNSFELTLFHGLTDFYGLWLFVKNVIYYYGKYKGLKLPDIRDNKNTLDSLERYNPYVKYADNSVVSEYKNPKNIDSFKIDDIERIDPSLHLLHEYHLKTSTSKFLELTHKWNTSFVPVIVSILNKALVKLYDIKDKDIVVRVPVDMRRVFNNKTRDNFSVAINMLASKETLTKPIEEQCADLRNQINLEIKEDDLKLKMASTIETVEYKEGKREAINIKIPSLPITYNLTYIGIVELPKEYDVLVKNFVLRAFEHIDTFKVTVKTTGDEMLFSFTQAFDDDFIVKAFKKELEEYGLDSNLIDLGRLSGDKYSIDMIK